MDPSAFIFVGLAVAWAAYLIPKALEHHDAGARSRTVEKFSHTMRVIARREPVDRRQTRLVTNRKPSAAPVPEPPRATAPAAPAADPEQTGFFAAQTFVRRSAGSRAARRRRRVLGGLLVLTAMTGAVCAGQVISWWWAIAPVTLLVAWLVACRVMVKGERAAVRLRPAVQRITDPREQDTTGVEDVVHLDDTAEVPAVRAQVAQAEPIASGDGWELVPVTLPTYVSKPKAKRTVRTIDLGEPGTWTSGRTAEDTQIVARAAANEADAEVAADAEQQRAVGS